VILLIVQNKIKDVLLLIPHFVIYTDPWEVLYESKAVRQCTFVHEYSFMVDRTRMLSLKTLRRQSHEILLILRVAIESFVVTVCQEHIILI
jgi:hypothetical protein